MVPIPILLMIYMKNCLLISRLLTMKKVGDGYVRITLDKLAGIREDLVQLDDG